MVSKNRRTILDGDAVGSFEVKVKRMTYTSREISSVPTGCQPQILRNPDWLIARGIPPKFGYKVVPEFVSSFAKLDNNSNN